MAARVEPEESAKIVSREAVERGDVLLLEEEARPSTGER
jgi:hypothetical protein